MDVINFPPQISEDEESSQLSAASLMASMAESFVEGPDTGVKAAMVAWINEAGLVEYRVSNNIDVDSAIVMCAAVTVDASLRLYGGNETQE